MTDETFMLAHALKAQQWEKAKGELRALIALQGAHSSDVEGVRSGVWIDLRAAVEDFIHLVETNGWAE